MKVIEINEKNHHIKLSIKDINYRKGHNGKIQETLHGFSTLKNNIPLWIEEKINEINKK